ncbi:hypothetical protein FRC98_05420 [Lujinxingia vulgaris]|uniref:TIL domain-containing protein n=1 Tax=Lujinxingia vulgaris TaxID=2600176 RepID=A0A5C6XHL4_9DELT|nr:hypothetical protein [Lujinxingia vulgaris]TXD38335.1 hypothetical protein FRC98_05420 [Lujinxingia vulgaris]
MSVKKWMLAAAVLLMVGCGAEATDRPEDCRQGEYYNEANEECMTCPAVQEPQCREGCGLEIFDDQRGCPVARCESGCEGCADDEVYEESTNQCVAPEPA